MTFETLRENRKMQLILGVGVGIAFGFLLQKGQVTKYDVIMGQLLLRDFTVVKIMLTAIVTGMFGIYVLNRRGLVNTHVPAGSFGSVVPGGLMFGIGMALLGYCPGTNAGAVGQGSMDALLGGMPGIIAGSIFYAMIYPRLDKTILTFGAFGRTTLPEFFHAGVPRVMAGLYMAVVTFFFVLEVAGY